MGFLLLPIFTLKHKNSKITKQIQMRKIKKFKMEKEQAKEEEVESLYDADMGDLDSSDIGEQEKLELKRKNTSVYDLGMQSNMTSL